MFTITFILMGKVIFYQLGSIGPCIDFVIRGWQGSRSDLTDSTICVFIHGATRLKLWGTLLETERLSAFSDKRETAADADNI